MADTSKTPNPLAPFKIGRPDLQNGSVNSGHIKKVYYKNNYTNQILHIVSHQVNLVSTHIEATAKKLILNQ